MNDKARSENVLRNAWVGILFHTLTLVLGFVSRTVFIHILSSEYLGLNSLFTNILTILSFAELGIGNAIVFSMYKPIADNNQDKLKKLVNFYKKTYTTIGLIILIVGILLIPFLNMIITDAPNLKESIYVIYLFFLADTAISYFFSYKTSIISADQKNYIIIVYTHIFKVIQVIVQLVILYFTKNYLLYLGIQVATTFLTNFYLAKKAEKMYPFVKKLGKETITLKEKKGIFTNVKALFIYKFGSVILNGTDSIIISKMLGLVTLGLYSNYQLLLNAIIQLLNQLFNSFTSSIGNLIAKGENLKTKLVFNELFYFTELIYCIVCISTFMLFNDFVKLWLGNNYLLPNFVVFTIVFHLYINGIQFAGFSFRNASGNFRYFRYAPIVSSVVNIVVSIVLAKWIGLAGIFIGTIVARLSTTTWIDPYIVYKHVFKEKKISEYFLKYFKYLAIVAIAFVACYYTTKEIIVTNIFMFILKGIVLVLMTSFIFILFTFRTLEFNNLKNRFKYFINSKLRRC